MSKYFLGLDASTQSIKGTIIDFETKDVVYEKSINFEDSFADIYNIKSGIIVDSNPLIVHSYPKMWVHAIDLLFAEMKSDNAPLDKILAISGSGQQHGSVYLNDNFLDYLNNLKNKTSLLDGIDDIFSRKTSPIWMDSSTEKECDEIRKSIGGVAEVCKLTGSDVFARFTASQIRKFYKQEEQSYNNTKHIHLVSSFLASIMSGISSPIDYGDGAGMNMMDIEKCIWNEKCLSATSPNLKDKMTDIVSSDTCIGNISEYFVKNYNVNKDATIVVFSGDNPNSMIGVGLTNEGQAAYSLGTSDVYMSLMKKLSININGEGHIFRSPTGDYMTLLVYKNGSLAREQIRDKYKLNWTTFTEALIKTKAGNNGGMMLPYFYPEIIPVVTEPKVIRKNIDESDAFANVRAIIEAQMLSSRVHSDWMNVDIDTIYATGGASKDKEICKVMANVHKADVYNFDSTNSASLGSAIRALHAYYKKEKRQLSWAEATTGFVHVDEKNKVSPNIEDMKVYDEMAIKYKELESEYFDFYQKVK